MAPLTCALTAYVEQDPETGVYAGIVPGVPGAHTQATTLDELRHNLEEVVGLILEAHEARGEPISIPRVCGDSAGYCLSVTRLPMLDARTMERVLFGLGFIGER